MMNICILDGETLNPGDLNWKVLEKHGALTIYQQTKREEIVERAVNADIIIVNKVILDEKILAQLPKLKYVVVSATGFNNIDINAFKKRNIPVSNVVNYGTMAVAQHTFALLLALTNRVSEHNEAVQKGQWSQTDNFCFWNMPLIELKGKKIGIIGMGNIAQKVAEISNAFEMEILYYSKSNQYCKFGKQQSLDYINKNSDIITLHTHLSDDNEGFINSAFLENCKNNMLLINTSRGKLINEKDLYSALQNKIIAGAALDTLSEEPIKSENSLIGASNCIITPHIAWAPVETRNRMMDLIAQNIKQYLDDDIKNRIA